MSKKKIILKKNEEIIKRRQKLEMFREQVNKKYGRDLYISGEKRSNQKLNRFSTGSFWLDYALGGGIPNGRVTSFFGDKSSSKTTICKKVIVDAQRRNKKNFEYIDLEKYEIDIDNEVYVNKETGEIIEPFKCAFIDLEGTFDDRWFSMLGGIPEWIEYIMPDYGEQAVDIVHGLIGSELVDIIIIDSLAALTPITEIEKSAEDNHVGLQPRLLNHACRKWVSELNKISDFSRRPTILTINQMRQKIGVMFGNPDTIPGGKGQRFLSSIEVRTRAGKTLHLTKDNYSPLWTEMKGQVEKNKTAPPKIDYHFNLANSNYIPPTEGTKKYPCSFNAGDILEHQDVIKFASKFGIISKTEDEKQFCVNLIGHDEPIIYKRKTDLLDEWFYNNKQNYQIIKLNLLQLMTNPSGLETDNSEEIEEEENS